jgi:hypothetical protein
LPYYMFYWYSGRDDDERFLARVNADSETVKKLIRSFLMECLLGKV